jgi:hypothetical protein
MSSTVEPGRRDEERVMFITLAALASAMFAQSPIFCREIAVFFFFVSLCARLDDDGDETIPEEATTVDV